VLAMLAAAGCGPSRPVRANVPAGPVPVAGVWVEQGIASWYGLPFNGRHAADGSIYNMNQATAAHRTLPFGSILRVTNLDNGKQTEVRVTDRGPFVRGRIIDLSFAAARSVDMVGPGTARVKLELLSISGRLDSPPLLSSPGATVAAVEAGNFTVQVGAFSLRDNAERLRDRLMPQYAPIFIRDFDGAKGRLYRVLAGREPSEQRAEQLAAQLRTQEHVDTFVVRLDETP
jgi:rare lipoprotein A